MKKNNGGYSLIELVVIMAIVAILSGVFVYNLGRISGFQAKECRKKVYSSLTNGQLITLSKSRGGVSDSDSAGTYLLLFKNTDDGCNYCYTIVEHEITDVKKISKGKVTIEVSYSADGSGSVAIGTNTGLKNVGDDDSSLNGVRVAYSRQNGAFLPNGTGDYIYKIYAKAGMYQYEISLHPKTGRVEIGERSRLD